MIAVIYVEMGEYNLQLISKTTSSSLCFKFNRLLLLLLFHDLVTVLSAKCVGYNMKCISAAVQSNLMGTNTRCSITNTLCRETVTKL